MNQDILLALVVAAAVGLGAVILILRRGTRERKEADRESPFGTSTEGMKVCPHCGGQNLVSDATCSYCQRPLKG